MTTGSFGVVDSRHVRLRRIGLVRTKEPTTKLRVRLAGPRAHVGSATVTEAAGRWHVSFTCQVERAEWAPSAGGAVGVDVGVRSLAVCSQPVPGLTDSHGIVANPKHASRYGRRMARLQRECSRRRGPIRANPTLSKR